MKTSELRIGNFLKWKNEYEVIVSVEAMAIDKEEGCVIDYKEIESGLANTIQADEFEGVPLTEEWLLKFGFEKSEGEEFIEWGNDKTFILQDKEKKYYYPYGSTINIEFVHQFQNLIFALTGEELQISPHSQPLPDADNIAR